MTDLAPYLALIAAVLSAASILLHAISPRTKTTLDDRLAADIDEALRWFRSQPGAVTKPAAVGDPTLTAKVLGGAPPGRVRTGALLMLATIAAGVLVAGVASSGCATASRIGTVAKGSAIECGKVAAGPVLELAADLGVQAALDALNLGEVDVPGLEARAVTEGLEIAGCAALRFAERWHASAPKSQGLLARVDPSAALLARLRARYGATWTP